MWINRINGREDLYVGGIFGLRRSGLLQDHNITHVLSVINYKFDTTDPIFRDLEHLSIDIDDMEDQDLLVYFSKMVRFIERGLYSKEADDNTIPDTAEARSESKSENEDRDAILPAPPQPDADLTSAQLARLKLTPAAESKRGPSGPSPTGAVLVHCAMGKSRSVSAVIAYLLWKHPHRFGRANPTTKPREAVVSALKWVRDSRPVAEPNDGFMRQLELWWEMGCPAHSDDAVEREPVYQRWLYKSEVDDAVRLGRAPDWIRFEDEEAEKEKEKNGKDADAGGGTEIRCKKCRRVLATQPFIVPHQGRGNPDPQDCPHVFVEALSWMRPTLEEGVLEGRLACPNPKCGASIGRYAWQGFKCSCGDWVAPAMSLQKSKVDEVSTAGRGRGGDGPVSAANRMAALGIRMPPPGSSTGGREENL